MNDFGFTTVSAEDYTKTVAPPPPAPTVAPVDLSGLVTRLDALISMIETVDNKIDIADDKVEAIGQHVGAVERVLLEGEDDSDMVPRERLIKLSEMVLPLLRNLRDTAKDEYIRWPNRGPVLSAQINAIEALLQ